MTGRVAEQLGVVGGVIVNPPHTGDRIPGAFIDLDGRIHRSSGRQGRPNRHPRLRGENEVTAVVVISEQVLATGRFVSRRRLREQQGEGVTESARALAPLNATHLRWWASPELAERVDPSGVAISGAEDGRGVSDGFVWGCSECDPADTVGFQDERWKCRGRCRGGCCTRRGRRRR